VKLSNLRGAVCLQPLSDGQIQEYLGQVGKLELWQQIQAVPEMAKLLEPVAADEDAADEDKGDPGLLRVPLFIGLAARVYDPQKPWQGKAELFKRYIDRQLSPEVRESDRLRKEFNNRDWAYKTLEREPDWRDVRRSLGWLAGQLQDRNQVELLIEKMQPSWLDEGRSRWTYRISSWLIFGLLVGLTGGFLFGLLFGLIGGLMFKLNKIEPVEGFKISRLRKARREMVEGLRQGLRQGLLLGLILVLLFGLIGGLIGGLSLGLTGGSLFGLLFGLISAPFLALFFGMFLALKQGLKTRSHPNQGIWNSLKSTIWTAVLSYPVAVMLAAAYPVARRVAEKREWINLAGILYPSSSQLLLDGLFGAFFFAFYFGGGSACIQHLCLRFVLTHDRKIPWNYARFLNHCVERRLLQRIGGRYRFIHRELLDHFVNPKNHL